MHPAIADEAEWPKGNDVEGNGHILSEGNSEFALTDWVKLWKILNSAVLWVENRTPDFSNTKQEC